MHTLCIKPHFWIDPTHSGPNTTCKVHPYDKNITIHKSDYNQLVRVKPAGCWRWPDDYDHSQADTHVINATPILLFLDLGHDGDGNGTLVQCACMTIAFHIVPYFFPSQHTTLVFYIMHQCISSTFDLSPKAIHIISGSSFSKQFYKYLFWHSYIVFQSDEVAEWLRRWTANPLGSARVGSNPILVEIFLRIYSLFLLCFVNLVWIWF